MIKPLEFNKISKIRLFILLKFYNLSLKYSHKNYFYTTIILFRICFMISPYWDDLWLQYLQFLYRNKKYRKAALLYKESIYLSPNYSTIHKLGEFISKKGTINDSFHKEFISLISDAELRSMLISLRNSNTIYHPSKFWLYHLVFNIIQIEHNGIENFKRSVNKNYFGWSHHTDIKSQIETINKNFTCDTIFFLKKINKDILELNQMKEDLTIEGWMDYIRLLILLYSFAKSQDTETLFKNVEESPLGNPIWIPIEGINVSQDLPNTIFEINTFAKHLTFAEKENLNVIELGAGHGRVGQLMLQKYNNMKYTIVDIPPALFISQWYLTNSLKGKNVFKFREFHSWDSIKDEFESADIRFLLPHQIEMMPDKYFNLFINISSMGEMTEEQIMNWFHHINRCTRGIFFLKQYTNLNNSFDSTIISKEDYPSSSNWKVLLDRTNPLFSSFFETIYRIE